MDQKPTYSHINTLHICRCTYIEWDSPHGNSSKFHYKIFIVILLPFPLILLISLFTVFSAAAQLPILHVRTWRMPLNIIGEALNQIYLHYKLRCNYKVSDKRKFKKLTLNNLFVLIYKNIKISMQILIIDTLM